MFIRAPNIQRYYISLSNSLHAAIHSFAKAKIILHTLCIIERCSITHSTHLPSWTNIRWIFQHSVRACSMEPKCKPKASVELDNMHSIADCMNNNEPSYQFFSIGISAIRDIVVCVKAVILELLVFLNKSTDFVGIKWVKCW